MSFFSFKKSIKKNSELKIPKHVAIIMDGNARWAKQKNLPLQIGHKKGCENIEKIVDSAIEIGIEFLTIYAFSTENWQRPRDEVNYLMKLLDEYLDNEIKPLIKKDVKIIISGNLEKLNNSTKDKISKTQDLTKNNKKIVLNVAFSYGSRQEITDAVKKIAIKLEEQKISIQEIDENLIAKNLYNPQIPDPELLIRTAGDYRLSNFLLWQISYSELYFTKCLWPDFSRKDLILAIQDFNKRQRRYGRR